MNPATDPRGPSGDTGTFTETGVSDHFSDRGPPCSPHGGLHNLTQATGWVRLTRGRALWKAGRSPASPGTHRVWNPAGQAGRAAHGRDLVTRCWATGKPQGVPRPGRARHMNNECALPPLISILDQRHRPALGFHSWLQRRSTARARTEEGDEGRWSPGVCVCGGVPRTPKVKSSKASGCRTHRHRGRSAGRRSGSRAPTEPAPGSVPQRETWLETVATGPSEAHPARPLSSASAPEVALRHLLSL